MKTTYRVLAYLIALGVVLQASFIAGAWFGVISDLEDGGVFTTDSEGNLGHLLHSIGGNAIPALALILLIVSFFAKVPGGVKWALIVFGVTVLQFALAIVAFGVPAVGALHGLNAFALLAVASMAGRRATRVVAETPAAEQPPVETPV